MNAQDILTCIDSLDDDQKSELYRGLLGSNDFIEKTAKLTELSLINNFKHYDKHKIADEVISICQLIEDGYLSPVTACLVAKVIGEIGDGIKEQARQLAVDKCKGIKGLTEGSYKVDVRAGAPNYDFTRVNEWKELKEYSDNYAKLLKEMEKTLIAFKVSGEKEFIDEPTGVVIHNEDIIIRGYKADSIVFSS